jgi:hypothetical protein
MTKYLTEQEMAERTATTTVHSAPVDHVKRSQKLSAAIFNEACILHDRDASVIQTRGTQSFQTCRSHLKILDARKVT